MCRTRLLLVHIALLAAAFACARADETWLGGPPDSTSTPPPYEPTRTHIPTTALPPTVQQPQASRRPPSPRPTYEITAWLYPLERRIEVEQRVTYPNTSGTALNVLCFMVDANRTPDVFFLDHIRGAEETELSDYRLDGPLLWVPLPEPLPDGRSTTLELKYTLFPPGERKPFGFTGRQLNLTDWYPYVPPYQVSDGWVTHEPAPVGEHLPYPSADFHAVLHLEASPQAWTLALPTTALEQGGVFEVDLQGARDLALSMSREFVQLEAEDEQFSVRAYVFPEHVFVGRHALDVALRSMQLYSELFGPPPQRHLTIVEADFPDGRECSGLVYLDQFYFETYARHPRGWLTPLTAHEISHQWWFNLVGNDPALEPWLDEALATYSELLYFERYHPDLVPWWWAFRVQTYAPEGDVGSTIYEHPDFRAYVDAVYLRGASFLEALRSYVGDTELLAILRRYADEGAYRINTSTDFLRLLQASTDADVQPVFSSFFLHPPRLRAE